LEFGGVRSATPLWDGMRNRINRVRYRSSLCLSALVREKFRTSTLGNAPAAVVSPSVTPGIPGLRLSRCCSITLANFVLSEEGSLCAKNFQKKLNAEKKADVKNRTFPKIHS